MRETDLISDIRRLTSSAHRVRWWGVFTVSVIFLGVAGYELWWVIRLSEMAGYTLAQVWQLWVSGPEPAEMLDGRLAFAAHHVHAAFRWLLVGFFIVLLLLVTRRHQQRYLHILKALEGQEVD